MSKKGKRFLLLLFLFLVLLTGVILWRHSSYNSLYHDDVTIGDLILIRGLLNDYVWKNSPEELPATLDELIDTVGISSLEKRKARYHYEVLSKDRIKVCAQMYSNSTKYEEWKNGAFSPNGLWTLDEAGLYKSGYEPGYLCKEYPVVWKEDVLPENKL